MSLPRAVTALTTGDQELALAQLISAWRQTPAATIAGFVDRMASHFDGQVKPVVGRNRREYHVAWLARAHKGRPEDVGELMAALPHAGTVADVTERIGVVERWARDPRLGVAMVGILCNPHISSTRGQPFYAGVFRVIERVADRRVLPALIDLTVGEPDEEGDETARIEKAFGQDMGWWMRNRLEQCIRTLKELGPEAILNDDQRDDCARINDLFGISSDHLHGRERTVAELLQSIRDDPRNDHVRQVYADLLVEADDPRGVFIQLQYRRHTGTLTRAQGRQERLLRRDHWKTWVGDLLPVLNLDSVVFERGFLARVLVLARSRRAGQRVIGLPEWATVEQVQLRPPSDGYRPFDAILHPSLRALKTLRHIATEDELLGLLEGQVDRGVETLGIDAVALAMWGSRGSLKDVHLGALGECRRLPQLRRLEMACPHGPANFDPSPSTLGWLVNAPVAARIESLYLGSALRHLGDWIPLLTDSPLQHVEIDGSFWSVVLTRGPDGKMAHLYATPRRGVTDAASGELGRAMEGVRRGALTRFTLEGDHPEIPSVAVLAERVVGAEVTRKKKP